MKCCRTYGLNKRSLYKEEVIRPSAPSSRHRPGQNGHRNRNIGVWGKSRAPLLMRLLFGFPDEKQLMGAYSKVPNQRSTKSRDERPQTGAQAPGNSATTKEAPRGRQRTKQVVIKRVRYSVAPLGLTIVLYPCPGGLHPRLWSLAPPVLFPGLQ